jgi:DNA-binding NarL/FixJ family response regulator
MEIPTYPNEASPAPTPFPELTEREREVALNLATGASSRETAATLEISTKTIDTHRAHILKKTKCRNNVELARLAIRLGYVQP